MKTLIKSAVTDWHTVFLTVIAALWIAYKAAYPYVNPDNLQWQNAIIQAVLAVLGLLVYQHHIVSLKLAIDGRPTLHMPTVGPDTPNG